MRIQKLTLRSRVAQTAVAIAVCLGVASSASAGTVYSWQTDDGTFAYTDDRKRIPARYRDQARARSMQQLSKYERFTPSSVKVESDYGKRLYARLDHLRDGGAVAMAAPGPDGEPTSAAFLVRMSGNRDRTTTQMSVPAAGVSSGPITVDNIRVRPNNSSAGRDGSMATRHITVVRQGDRVISVSRPHHNQRRLISEREREVLE